MARDLLIRGRFVITDPRALPAGGMIENGAVLASGGMIVKSGAFETLRVRHPDAEIVGTDRFLMIPGLINAHHHGRGLQGIQLGIRDEPLETWLLGFIGQPPLDVYLDTLHANLRLIRSGVTTVLHSAYTRVPGRLETETRDALRAYTDAGLRVAYAVGIEDRVAPVHDGMEMFLASLPPSLARKTRAAFPAAASADLDDYFAAVARLRRDFAEHPLVTLLHGPNWPVWCSDELLRRIARVARGDGMGVHIHVLESPFEREAARRHYGKSVVTHLDTLGLLGAKTSIAHGVWLSDADIETCARTKTSVCHNASSNLRLRNGIAPVTRMLERGVNVGIGMDGYALNSDDDMLQEMRLVAALHGMPGDGGHRNGPDAFEVFRMATVGGARAALQSSGGTLLPGSTADAVLIDFEAMRGAYLDPGVHPVEALVHLGRAAHVNTVVIGGQIVLSDGHSTRHDEGAIARALAEIAETPLPEVADFALLARELKPHVAQHYANWPVDASAPHYRVNARF
ncbi:MAG: amidohydrolase family protein [Alphaproteobacteria bacterium]